MKTTDFINESFIEDAAAAHQDHEVQMARADCYNAAKYAIELHKLLKNISEQEGLDGWVSEKITLANDYLRTVTEYLRYEQQAPSSDMPEFDARSATQTLDSVLGESTRLNEGAFTWYLKAHGRLLSPLTSDEPYKFNSKEEAVAFAKQKYKTNWQNIVPTTYDVPDSLAGQHDPGWDGDKLKPVQEDDYDDAVAAFLDKNKPVQGKTHKPRKSERLGGSRHIGGGGEKMKASRTGIGSMPTGKAIAGQAKLGEQGFEEGKADPVGSWVVYDGSKVKRFKSREGAKAYAEKNGGKVASSEHYADNIQKQGVTEGSYKSQFSSKEDAIQYAKEKVKTFRDPMDGIEIYAMPDGGADAVHTMNSNGRNHTIANGGKKLGTITPKDSELDEGTWYAGNGAIKEKIAKYEELALAANRAGDDAKTKMYQQKIQTLKQKMSHMEESAGGMGAGSIATSMGGGNGFANGGPGTIARPRMKKKK